MKKEITNDKSAVPDQKARVILGSMLAKIEHKKPRAVPQSYEVAISIPLVITSGTGKVSSTAKA